MSEEVKIPMRRDPEWTDYVLSFLKEDELSNGNPTTAGLRRVIELVYGTIVRSQSHVVHAPTNENRIAIVEHTLEIAPPMSLISNIFTDVADCTSRNTDAPYNQYLIATCSTRAEGRALRRALGLKKAVAEELSDVANEAPSDNDEERIKDVQVKTIDTLCKRAKINVQKFVNSGSQQYNNIREVKYNVAQQMVKQLNVYQGDTSKIPDDQKGYIDDWRSTFE